MAYRSDRLVPSVPHPATNLLRTNELWNSKGVIQIEKLREHLKLEGRLETECCLKLFSSFTELAKKEKNVLEVEAPCVVVGDIHGQYYDLLKMFDIVGDPTKQSTHKYLFLGDYVDRGYFSIEVVIYLWAMKLSYPNQIFLLRGNHECRHLTGHFTFRQEVWVKYDDRIYQACMTAFDALSLCAIMAGSFFCVHGGISPDIKNLDSVKKINRNSEPPTSGIFCDLLWGDPAQDFGAEKNSREYVPNQTRGCSYYFSFKAVCKFLDATNCLSVIRAHEVQESGYRMYKNTPEGFPAVITLFSAPNYLDVYGNKGAVIVYENNTMNIRQFSASPHPYWLPNFVDVFTWSLPFVGEKVTELLLGILNVVREAAIESNLSEDEMTKKLNSIKKMSEYFRLLREESLTLVDLKGLTPTDVPVYDVHGQDEQMHNVAADYLPNRQKRGSIFDLAREADERNEHMPKVPLAMMDAAGPPPSTESNAKPEKKNKRR